MLFALVLISAISYAFAEQKTKAAESADDAIAWYKVLVKESSGSIGAQCGLADAYIRKYHETSEKKLLFFAKKAAIKAGEIAPESPLPHISLARLYDAMEKHEKAIGHAQKAASLEPGNPEVLKMLEELGIKVEGGITTSNEQEVNYQDGNKYSGSIVNGLRHGQGTYIWSDGRKYVGEWSNNLMQGQGTMKLPNGAKLVGEFDADKKSFQGDITELDSTRYEGVWLDNQGHGTITWLDGDKYVGEWKDDKACDKTLRHGHGTMTRTDGSKYIGEWVDDKRTGHGNFTWPDGAIYVGNWKDDKLNGQGSYTWADSGKYEGEWKNGIRHGQGTHFWINDNKYKGEWKGNLQNGQGTFTWADGSKYTGDWVKGNRHGQGTNRWATGDKYTGEWKNNRQDGQGTFIWSNGSIYTGEYRDNIAVGGWYYWSDGNITWSYISQGKWINKKSIKIEKIEFTNGDKYSGNIVNGGKKGQGIYIYSDGGKYAGGWNNDLKAGYGTLIWAEGNKYTGYWKDNKQNGIGTLIWAAGSIYEGEWKNDHAVGGWYYWPDGRVTWAYEDSQGKWVNKKSKPQG